MPPHNFENPSTTEEVLEDEDDEGFISFGSSKYNFHIDSKKSLLLLVVKGAIFICILLFLGYLNIQL